MYLFPLLNTSLFLGPSLSWSWFWTLQNRNVLVGIETRQRDRRSTNRGLNSREGEASFFSPQVPERLWNSPSFPYSGYRWLSRRIKRLGRERDHPLRNTAEFKDTSIVLLGLTNTSACFNLTFLDRQREDSENNSINFSFKFYTSMCLLIHRKYEHGHTGPS
jgi:hypothetical protein